MLIKLLTTLIIIGFSKYSTSFDEKLDKYTYMLKRNKIRYLEEKKHIQIKNQFSEKFPKNSKQQYVELYFQYLKKKEIETDNKYFYYPLENSNLEYVQKKSKLYKLLRALPKGGNLHLHEFQELDRSKLFDLLNESIDSEYIYICDQIENDNCKNIKYFMNYFKDMKKVPSGWTKLKESKLTKQEIIDKTTLIGLLKGLKLTGEVNNFSEMRWNITLNAELFLVYQNVAEYATTRYKYLKAVLDSALDENVQLIELRRPDFGTMWYYGQNGSIEYVPALDELKELKKLKQEYIEKNEKFIDFSFIIFGLRSLPNYKIDSIIEAAINYNKHYPDLVRGFDLVEEEDKGHTLLYHSDSLIKARNYGKFESNDTFKLYLHNGETNWAENQPIYRSSDDVSTLENIYDAIVLEAHRLGHGLGYIKHPQLYKVLIENNIAIELCLTSNHILGYTPDLRTHPGVNYYRSGIPVVLAGDDPGTFGYNELTLDYYFASLAWDLNLYDLKQIALNSIKYSSLSNSEKPNAFLKWNKEWEKFIESYYNLVCHETRNNSIVEITDILPTYSYFNLTTNITVYGTGFENFFCKKIICNFGNYKTSGSLIQLNEIVCESPTAIQTYTDLHFKLLIFNFNGSLMKEIDSSFNFTILSDPKLFEIHRKYEESLVSEYKDRSLINSVFSHHQFCNFFFNLIILAITFDFYFNV